MNGMGRCTRPTGFREPCHSVPRLHRGIEDVNGPPRGPQHVQQLQEDGAWDESAIPHATTLRLCARLTRSECWTAAAKLICHDRRALASICGGRPWKKSARTSSLASITQGKVTAKPLRAPRNSGRRGLEPLIARGASAPRDPSTP